MNVQFIDKETEAQKDKYIPQGQRTIKKENQKAGSDGSDPGLVQGCCPVTRLNQECVLRCRESWEYSEDTFGLGGVRILQDNQPKYLFSAGYKSPCH